MDFFTPEVIAILTTAATVVAVNALQAIAKSISDDATGWKGLARKAIKFITAYVENNTGKEKPKTGEKE